MFLMFIILNVVFLLFWVMLLIVFDEIRKIEKKCDELKQKNDELIREFDMANEINRVKRENYLNK